MSWTLLGGLAVVLGLALLVALARRAELRRMHRAVRDRDEAVRPDSVALSVRNGQGAETITLPNDDVFVMVGGTPPLELLTIGRLVRSFAAQGRRPGRSSGSSAIRPNGERGTRGREPECRRPDPGR